MLLAFRFLIRSLTQWATWLPEHVRKGLFLCESYIMQPFSPSEALLVHCHLPRTDTLRSSVPGHFHTVGTQIHVQRSANGHVKQTTFELLTHSNTFRAMIRDLVIREGRFERV